MQKYISSKFLNRLTSKARRATVGRLYVDTHDYRRTVVLAGTGRSGTTWVENIINYDNGYRVMFEPFHSQIVPIVRHFRYRQYLRPGNRDPLYLEPARAILSGNVRNPWIDGHNRKLIAKKRLIKDVRANHLLKWIKANFPEIPIVLLLRHPCAVAYSKLALNWNTHLDEFLSQEELMQDFLGPFRDEIESVESVFDKHIFLWCIENYVPLKQFRTGEFHLAFYELFCAQPEHEVDRLFHFLGENYDKRVFKSAEKPSTLARLESAVVSHDSPTEGWKRHLSREQVRRSLDILGLFGLDAIYSDQSLPRITGEENPFVV